MVICSTVARERLGEYSPHPLGLAGAELAHVSASLVAPRPQIFHARSPGGLDGSADVVRVLRAEAEALDLDLGAYAVLLAEVADQAREPLDKVVGGVPEGLPIRIGRQSIEAGHPRHNRPVGEAQRTLRER